MQKLKDNSAVIKNLQSQMSASAKEAGQIVIPVKGSSVRPGTGGHATPKATPQKKVAAPAVEGSMDWYEQRLAELRKQLRAAADLRQSYQNAQARATRIQQDYEIGLIGKDKALADIAEINLALEKLGDNGMKPIEIGVMTEDADKAGKSLQDATAAIGSMGQALSGPLRCPSST